MTGKKFMRRIGRSSGLVAALLALTNHGAARAACSTANTYNFSFASQPDTNLNYAGTYTYTAASTALGNNNFTVSFTTAGVASTIVASRPMPQISNYVTDGVAARNLVLGVTLGARTPSITGTANIVVTTFTFATPIRDFSMQLNDVDFGSNQFRDWIHVVGNNGASSYVPSITTPWGTSNATGGTRTNASSSMVVGASPTPVSVTSNQTAGTGTSNNNATTGTLTASFAQPVTSVQVRWGNFPLQPGETATGQQAIGIQRISYCPMPALTVVKQSTPVVTALTDPKRFRAPSNDIFYSITVSNSNSSPVEGSAIVVTDALPAATTFFNGDIDGTGPLTTNYEFVPGTSGLTLSAGNIAYSNNGGAAYTYTPASGYDTAANALRFIPQGTMAANSSFTVRFRTRIK